MVGRTAVDAIIAQGGSAEDAAQAAADAVVAQGGSVLAQAKAIAKAKETTAKYSKFKIGIDVAEAQSVISQAKATISEAVLLVALARKPNVSTMEITKNIT